MPEPGRGTPTGTRTFEDPSEIDVRALLQKHEELRELIIGEQGKKQAMLIEV
jgi:hypothetical protein